MSDRVSRAGKLPRRVAAGAAALVVAASLCVQAAAELVPIAGTKISLDRPAGFTPAKQFPGFRGSAPLTSIMVTEMPAPVGRVRAGMSYAGLAARGMTLLGTEKTTVSGREALLLSVSQNARTTVVHKWILLLGDERNTVIMVGTFPRALAGSLGEDVKRAVLSARWSPDRVVDPFEGLGFQIVETHDLKIASRMANMLLLTEDGETARGNPSDPVLVVGTSLDGTVLDNLKRFSVERIVQTAEISGLDNFAGRSLKVDGLQAYELLADAWDTKTGTPLRVFQVVISKAEGYYILQGLVGTARGADYLDQFRRVAESLKRVR